MKPKPIIIVLLGSLLPLGTSACADTRRPASPESPTVELTITDLQAQLSPGDQGPAVSAVYKWLRDFGYFPNPELERRYPYWAPVIDREPRDPSLFGSELADAVTHFQHYFGLEETGTVNADTLKLMQQPRCAHPENELALRDPSDKFGWEYANGNPFIRPQNVTYKINQMSVLWQVQALDNATATWTAASNLNLSRTAGTPTVEIRMFPKGSPIPGWEDFASASDEAYTDVQGNRIALNTAWDFDLAAPNNANTVDLESVLLHEIGHSIGLDHSNTQYFKVRPTPQPAQNQPAMWPSGGSYTNADGSLTSRPTARLVEPDDRQALALAYNVWQQSPAGGAVNIAAGGMPGGTNQIWATDVNQNVWHWNGSAWVQVSGATGVAVTVDDNGTAWVVAADGTIKSGIGGSWISRGCCARDIAASGGNVYIISTIAGDSNGNYTVQTLSGTSWVTVNPLGYGTRIAADWLGRPWVVQANGLVWRLYTPGSTITVNKPGTFAWQLVYQGDPVHNQVACGVDISGASDASLWLLGCPMVGNSDYTIWQWNEQLGLSGVGQTSAPIEHQFLQIDGAGTRITASPDSRPWVANSAGQVWRRVPR